MSSTKEIKSRIKSIKDTQKITNAMYLISSTKMRKAKSELDQTRPYFNALREEIKRIFRTVKDLESQYFYPVNRDDFVNGTYGLLVITADKGLAGAYNMSVIKETMRLYNDHEDCKIYVVGEYGRQYFRRHNIPIEENFYYSDQNPTLDEAREITSLLLDRYLAGDLKKIFVIYTDILNNVESKAVSTRLLPFHREYFDSAKESTEQKVKNEFEFFPSVLDVLESVIESYLHGFIYGALIDSFCSEQNSRMNAMSQANTNADNILGDLSIEYNRVRQSAITQEITEVSAGAKAQKQKRRKRMKK